MADRKLRSLSASNALTGQEAFYADNGSDDVFVTAQQIKEFASAGITLTPSGVGLGNVTNDAQTKAAIVPNTVPSAGQVLVGNGTAYLPQAISGDATLNGAGAFTVTKTGGVPFGNAATKNVGTSAGTVAAGDDSRIKSVGTTAGTVAAGDDSRFSITQTGTGAVLINLFKLWQDRVFMPEMFGAVGDGVADDTNAINACINAAKAHAAIYGIGYVRFTRRYRTNSQIYHTGWTGTLHIDGKGSTFVPYQSVSGYAAWIFGNAGPTGSEISITADVGVGSFSLPVADATGFAADDLVLITAAVPNGAGTATSYIRQFLARVYFTSGSNTLNLRTAVPFPVNHSLVPSGYTAANVQKYAQETGKLVVENLTIEGANLTASGCTGFEAQSFIDSDFRNIRTMNCSGVNGQGIALNKLYDCRVDSLHDKSSGEKITGSSASINIYNCSECHMRNVVCMTSNGFGLLMDWVCNSVLTDFHAVNSAGRGIKHWGCCGTTESNFSAKLCGYTGIDFDSGCYGIQLNNVTTFSNGNEGLHFIGAGSTNNRVTNVNSRQNGSSGDVCVAGINLDNNNVIEGINDDAVCAVLSASTVGVVMRRRTPTAVSARRSADFALTPGSFVDVIPDTEVVDSGGEYNPSTGVFTAKGAGWYEISFHITLSTTIATWTWAHVGGEQTQFYNQTSDTVKAVVYLRPSATIACPQVSAGGAANAVATSTKLTVRQL